MQVGTELRPYSIYTIIKETAKRAGLDPKLVGAHSLRSGCCTYLLEKGFPAHIVQKHMRHKSFDTTQGYNQNQTAKNLIGAY